MNELPPEELRFAQMIVDSLKQDGVKTEYAYIGASVEDQMQMVRAYTAVEAVKFNRFAMLYNTRSDIRHTVRLLILNSFK